MKRVRLLGWFTEEVSEGTQIISGEIWTIDEPSIGIYTQYSLPTCSITYDLQGSHFTEGTVIPTSYTIENGDITLSTPVRENDH